MKTEIEYSVKENLESFFKERISSINGINLKIKSLKKEIEDELKTNKETLLAAASLGDTVIFLSKQTRDNLFSGVPYPETGLHLLSVEILHTEYTGSSEFEYFSNIIIRFNIEEPGYNSNWSEFSLSSLYWNDEKFKISEQSMGICLDPKFREEEYFEVKKVISELTEKVLNAIPKKAD